MTTTPTIPAARLLLPTPAAAETLSISPRTLWSLSAPRGPIPTVKVGRRVLYAIADLESWIARSRVEGIDLEGGVTGEYNS
ncbi:MAG: helix-turn-helix domain-containing protein [Pirellulales bacterium]